MEHCLEEARQQLNNIKASWSDKITALENQIRHLNAKIAEDQSDLQEAEGRTEALMSELSTLKAQNLSLVAEKAEMEEKLASEASLLKEDLETVRWQLNNTVVEKDTHIDTLRQQLSAEEVKHQSCAGVLQCKLENIATLEQRLMEMEEEAVVVKDNLTTAQAELVSAQNEKKSLQETLQQLRTTLETLERGKLEIKSKLDTVSSEKATLSRNLDEYVDKVGALERRVRTLENEAETNTTMLSETEAELTRVKLECEALRTQLRSSEDDLASKIEASEIVSGLKERVKNLEDELAEKKQALKVQGQRVADMKKTIQRELRLTADTAADIVADHRTDARPRDASPVTNGLATNTSADNGLNVNHTYLKHVIIKYLTSREYEAVHLTRAVATLLNMTTEEERLLRETLEWKMSWFGSKPNLGKGQTAKTIPPSQ
ncbi:hypothetical protein OTU49_005751 [Cherax quadricarinatus]|uniref:GRIP domain-containing protein n=2 Tax=Cherax quadricarinatus TaxID=27406 RepID=A0AAW0WRU3_CHEQU